MLKPFYNKKKNIDYRLVPAVSPDDAGKVLGITEDGKIAPVEGGGLPDVTATDNNDFLVVKNGAWAKDKRTTDIILETTDYSSFLFEEGDYTSISQLIYNNPGQFFNVTIKFGSPGGPFLTVLEAENVNFVNYQFISDPLDPSSVNSAVVGYIPTIGSLSINSDNTVTFRLE